MLRKAEQEHERGYQNDPAPDPTMPPLATPAVNPSKIKRAEFIVFSHVLSSVCPMPLPTNEHIVTEDASVPITRASRSGRRQSQAGLDSLEMDQRQSAGKSWLPRLSAETSFSAEKSG
jgi:hypothetical protein